MARSKIEAELLSHSSLSPETMVLAVEAEKERRGDKGYSFNCFTVDSKDKKSFPAIKEKMTELEFSLRALRSEFVRGNLQDGTRVQLLVKNGAHWTTLDLEFTKEKGVSAFILDAAKDARYNETLLSVYKTFKKYPHELYVCAGGMQYDYTSCAVFSLHHAFKASKIGDLHQDLKTRTGSFVEKRDLDMVTHRVSHTQLPPCLLSTLQRPASVADYLRMNPGVVELPITKKGSTLRQLVDTHTEERSGRFTNTYVTRVRDKAAAKATSYLQKIDDPSLGSLLNFTKRTVKGMKAMIDPTMPPPYHVRRVSGQISIQQNLSPLPQAAAGAASADSVEMGLSQETQQQSLDEEAPFVASDLMLEKQRTMKNEIRSGREQNEAPDTAPDTEVDSKTSTSPNIKS